MYFAVGVRCPASSHASTLVVFQLDLNSAPQNLVAWPTEPILRPTRAVIPPAFGVDISPIVWVMICSLIHEILLGQQGILNLMSNK